MESSAGGSEQLVVSFAGIQARLSSRTFGASGMAIFAIADLHLSLSAPDKDMAIFGAAWEGYQEKIRHQWCHSVGPDDLVLVAGDICWAMKFEQALTDLAWIHDLPGTKILLRGNHDYWWSSMSKMKKLLPPSLHLLHNNAFTWGSIGICGARLWDTDEFSFLEHVVVSGPKAPPQMPTEEQRLEQTKIFQREVQRLDLSLKALPKEVSAKIAMTHYPPVGPQLQPTAVSRLLDQAHVDTCVFGHLHSMQPDAIRFGAVGKTEYRFVAADAVDFAPQLIVPAALGPLKEWVAAG
jgi:predicted phosphohydrolase